MVFAVEEEAVARGHVEADDCSLGRELALGAGERDAGVGFFNGPELAVRAGDDDHFGRRRCRTGRGRSIGRLGG